MVDYVTYADGSSTVTKGGMYAGAPGSCVLVGRFDASRRTMAALDNVDILTIPAGFVVTNAVLNVERAEATATPTLNIGDTVTNNGYAAAVSVATLGRVLCTGAFIAAAGKLYATDTNLRLNVPTGKALTTLKGTVTLHGFFAA